MVCVTKAAGKAMSVLPEVVFVERDWLIVVESVSSSQTHNSIVVVVAKYVLQGNCVQTVNVLRVVLHQHLRSVMGVASIRLITAFTVVLVERLVVGIKSAREVSVNVLVHSRIARVYVLPVRILKSIVVVVERHVKVDRFVRVERVHRAVPLRRPTRVMVVVSTSRQTPSTVERVEIDVQVAKVAKVAGVYVQREALSVSGGVWIHKAARFTAGVVGILASTVFAIRETVLSVVPVEKRPVMEAVSINRLIHCTVVRVEIDALVARVV